VTILITANGFKVECFVRRPSEWIMDKTCYPWAKEKR